MKKINLIFSSAILLLASLGFIGNAQAQMMGGGSNSPAIGAGDLDEPGTNGMSANSTMNVAATIISVCSVQVFDLPFGQYNPSANSAPIIPMSLQLTCTKDTSVSLKMDGGKYSDGTDRYMLHTNGVEKLKYNMFSDMGNTLIPINTTYATTTATGSQQSVNISASIPVNQNIPAGSYQDTVVFSIEY